MVTRKLCIKFRLVDYGLHTVIWKMDFMYWIVIVKLYESSLICITAYIDELLFIKIIICAYLKFTCIRTWSCSQKGLLLNLFQYYSKNSLYNSCIPKSKNNLWLYFIYGRMSILRKITIWQTVHIMYILKNILNENISTYEYFYWWLDTAVLKCSAVLSFMHYLTNMKWQWFSTWCRGYHISYQQTVFEIVQQCLYIRIFSQKYILFISMLNHVQLPNCIYNSCLGCISQA